MLLYVVPTDRNASGFIGPIDSAIANPLNVADLAEQYETQGMPCMVIPGRPGIPRAAKLSEFCGFTARIYRAKHANFPEHVLARHASVVITGPAVPEHLRTAIPCGTTPPVILDRHAHSLRAVPAGEPDWGNLPYSFGDAFLWSPDSRWSQVAGQPGPIPLHDFTQPA